MHQKDEGKTDRRLELRIPDSELDVLMERLRAEIASKNAPAMGEGKRDEPAGNEDPQTHTNPLGVRELIALPEGEFVTTAYKTVLRRAPDADGRRYVERRLEIGLVSRLDVLIELRRSDEGREKRADVPGLARQILLWRLRHANPARVARSTWRLLRNIPRLALYMRSVVVRVEEAERRARTAEAIAQRTARELERTRESLRELSGRTADIAGRVERMEQRADERTETGG